MEMQEIKLSQEDRTLYNRLLDVEITDAREIEPPQLIMQIDGKRSLTIGNVSLLKGLSGHGKSTLLSYLVSQMRDNTEDFFKSEVQDDDVIVYLDTEQDDFDVDRIRNRIPAKNFRIFATREGFTPSERRDLVKEILENIKPKIFIIDGLTDLMTDPVGDNVEAQRLVEELCSFSSTYKCHIMNVVHLNEVGAGGYSTKGRGHIGSELERKCELSILVSYDKANKHFTVKCNKGRRGHFEDWAFEYDNAGKQVIFKGEAAPTTSDRKTKLLANLKENHSTIHEMTRRIWTDSLVREELENNKFVNKGTVEKAFIFNFTSMCGSSVTAKTIRPIIDNMASEGRYLVLSPNGKFQPAPAYYNEAYKQEKNEFNFNSNEDEDLPF